ANQNAPRVSGTAEAGATVRLYTDGSCTPPVAGSGTASAGGAFSISVSVADDSTTTFFGTATDTAGNTSACSAPGATYVEDSTPPAAPTLSGTVPASPANQNAPTVQGLAEAGSTVRLYIAAGCTSAVAGTGTATG